MICRVDYRVVVARILIEFGGYRLANRWLEFATRRMLELNLPGAAGGHSKGTAMTLVDKFEFYRSTIGKSMTISMDYKSQEFPGNTQGTCAAQVLYWFKGLAGQLKSGTGLQQQLLTNYDKSADLQFGALEDGGKLSKLAKETIDLRGNNTAELLKKKTPWTGTYKAYVIASDKGGGHMLGAYFPWTGSVRFYDPNLVAGTCLTSDAIYDILKLWPELYVGVGTQGAIWGFERLHVISDPEAAIKKLDT